MQPGQQMQVKKVQLWCHELKEGAVTPPPPLSEHGEWLPQQIMPGPNHALIMYAWVEEASQIAVPVLTGNGAPLVR